MLTVLRNSEGKIEAACEWWLTDTKGYQSNYGDKVRVEQLEISHGCEGINVIRRVIADIASRAPHATLAFWERRDKHQAWKSHSRRILVEEVNGHATV